MKPVRVDAVPFEDLGPKGAYWRAAFSQPSPLHSLLPIVPPHSIPFPYHRAEFWRERRSERKALVELLSESSPPCSFPQKRALTRLADPKALAVATGQQPGALGGPLFTFAKVLTTVILAERLEKEWSVPVIPILWDGGDDSDLEEIDDFAWPGPEGPTPRHSFGLSEAREGTPGHSVRLSSSWWDSLRDFVGAHHPPTEFRERTLSFLESLWRESQTWADFFDRFWTRVFEHHPLLVVRPWEPGLRRAAVPILEREVSEPEATLGELRQVSEELTARGFHPHVHKREGVCSFFLHEGGLRRPLTWESGRFRIAGAEESLSREALVSHLRNQPEDFSPNALLRPIVQDFILPTAVSVLGPSELAYHAQIGPMYARHNLPRPTVTPRFSMTLAADHQASRLEEMRISWSDLRRDTRELAKVRSTSRTLEKALRSLDDLAGKIAGTEESLRNLFRADRPGLVDPTEAQLGRAAKVIEQLRDLYRREEARRDSTLMARLSDLKGQFLPDGELQERAFGLVPFMCRFGLDWIEPLIEQAATWKGDTHMVVVIGAEGHD
ncbi:MAG: putative cysteine ligase BshC [bacterium]|nr:putative cysteine ligase BshC [bacterium]